MDNLKSFPSPEPFSLFIIPVKSCWWNFVFGSLSHFDNEERTRFLKLFISSKNFHIASFLYPKMMFAHPPWYLRSILIISCFFPNSFLIDSQFHIFHVFSIVFVGLEVPLPWLTRKINNTILWNCLGRIIIFLCFSLRLTWIFHCFIRFIFIFSPRVPSLSLSLNGILIVINVKKKQLISLVTFREKKIPLLGLKGLTGSYPLKMVRCSGVNYFLGRNNRSGFRMHRTKGLPNSELT